jgi:hypothetical protein
MESLQQITLALAAAYAGLGGTVEVDKLRKAYESFL